MVKKITGYLLLSLVATIVFVSIAVNTGSFIGALIIFGSSLGLSAVIWLAVWMIT